MKNEEHADQEAAPDGGGRVAHWRRSTVLAELKIVDAISDFLDRLRNRIDSSSERSNAQDDHKERTRAQPDHSGGSEVVAPPKSQRLVYLLAFTLTLIVGAAAGGAYSYRMLSKAIDGNGMVVDKLQDELADLKKQDALNRKELARRQRTIDTYDNGIARYLKEIDEYKTETEELRSQLSAARSTVRSTASTARRGSSSQDGRSSQAAAAGQPARSPKAGTCITDPANIAASLEKCIGEFNRN
jgi:hypothetical protein